MNFLNEYFNYNAKAVTYGLTNELISFYLLNLFNNEGKSVILVTSNTYEANNIYNSLNNYTENCLFFPMDDFLTSEMLAISPEFKMKRIETLNLLKRQKAIIITNLNGYLKHLPPKEEQFLLSIEKGLILNKKELLNKLDYLGYHRESIVTSTGEYANRGMIVDVFPFNEENPIRIEYSYNTIEEIKLFDSETQLSDGNINNIDIQAVDEIETSNYNSLYDYTDNGTVVYLNNQQIDLSYAKLQSEIKEFLAKNEISKKFMYEYDEIVPQKTLFINNIDNVNSMQISEINNFNENFNLLIKQYHLWKKDNKDIIFYLPLKKQREHLLTLIPDAKIESKKINKGFIIDKYVIVSDADIGTEVKTKINYKTNLKIGKKVKNYNDLEKGDYVVHISHGIGIYNGIVTLKKNNNVKDYLQILYLNNDKIYIPVEKINTIYKYSDKNGLKPKINKLNSLSWIKTRNFVKSKAKDISKELIDLYTTRAAIKGTPYKDYEIEMLFGNKFEYNLTKDQINAVNEISKDLNNSVPMDRLLCGDVGFGKTEVAIRAIYKTILNNKQVMYLCPTTILSNQQYEVIKERFKTEAVEIALLNRFVKPTKTKQILADLEKGKIDIIIGTHRLLSNDIKFKDIGLLVVDEEQRFGVKHKEKIKEYKSDINVLTLSATPIPRTMKMALSGLRDLSIIDTPPINRYPVQTYVLSENDLIIKDAIYKEMGRGGQIFILYNKISDICIVRNKLNNLVPEARIAVAHGRMQSSELENIMSSFINKDFDILLCTTIIENGIDISNANTLIVFDAENFGLSQLYQIRGRVGRSDKIGYAYLFYKAKTELNNIAVKRLQAIKEFTELGSGYKIAMRDMAIRGAGDIFGSDQAGFVDAVGISLYLKLVDDEIKKAHGEYVYEDDEQCLLDVSTHIKDSYVSDEDIKIEIHQMINQIDSYEKMETIKNILINRFGTIDNDLDVYMHQEWFSYQAKNLNINKIVTTDRSVEINLPIEISNKIKGEKLLMDILHLSTKFNINYKNKRISITLFYKSLPRHYIYYLVSLLEIISHNIQND